MANSFYKKGEKGFVDSTLNLGPFGQVGTGDVASALGKPIGGLLSLGMTSTAGSIIGGAADIVSAIPGPFGLFGGAALNVASGITNALFGSKENTANIQAANYDTSQLSTFLDVNSFDDIQGPLAVSNFSKRDIGKEGLFSNHITKLYNNLRLERRDAMDLANRNVNQNIFRLQEEQNRNALALYAAYGGFLSNGILDWDTDLVSVDSGGTHELNPYLGVQVGIDLLGTPNLVEEGEVIWDNNYVFSNRLKIPKYLLGRYGLNSKKRISFADLARTYKKRRDERPNDPITRATTERQLSKLQQDQEEFKIMKERANTITLDPTYENSLFTPYDIYNGPLRENELSMYQYNNLGEYPYQFG